MDKRHKEIKMSEIPDDLDIESLPEDVEIILDEEFPEMEDSYWEDQKSTDHIIMIGGIFILIFSMRR